MWQQLCLLHQLQEVNQNVVVVQEVSASVLFVGTPNSVNHLAHPDDRVFDLALYVRW